MGYSEDFSFSCLIFLNSEMAGSGKFTISSLNLKTSVTPMNTMRRFLLLAIIVSASVLTGCATNNPTLNFSPDDVLPMGKKIDYELKTITVSVAPENERVGETQIGFMGNQYEASFKQSFKDALEESIAKSAIFNDLSSNKLALTAKILQFQSPMMSTEFNTIMVVRYQLLDRSNGKLKFTRDIRSEGSVKFDHSFLGAVRFTEARNRSVKANVQNFLQSLGEFKE